MARVFLVLSSALLAMAGCCDPSTGYTATGTLALDPLMLEGEVDEAAIEAWMATEVIVLQSWQVRERAVQRLELQAVGDYLYLDVEANAFLHHMVRNIAGVLIAVGRGEQEPRWVQDILDKRDRTQGGAEYADHECQQHRAGLGDDAPQIGLEQQQGNGRGNQQVADH